MSIDLTRTSFGFYGMNEISSSATVGATLEYHSLQALEDTTVSYTSNGASENNQATFTSILIPQGAIIFGSFIGVSVSAGKLIGYLKG